MHFHFLVLQLFFILANILLQITLKLKDKNRIINYNIIGWNVIFCILFYILCISLCVCMLNGVLFLSFLFFVLSYRKRAAKWLFNIFNVPQKKVILVCNDMRKWRHHYFEVTYFLDKDKCKLNPRTSTLLKQWHFCASLSLWFQHLRLWGGMTRSLLLIKYSWGDKMLHVRCKGMVKVLWVRMSACLGRP